MNFAKAVKGSLTRSGTTIQRIDSQCEIEIGRHLSTEEKTFLFKRFSPGLVFSRIQEVLTYT